MLNMNRFLPFMAVFFLACGSTTSVNWVEPEDQTDKDSSETPDLPEPPDSHTKIDLNIPEAPPDGWTYEIIPLGFVDGKAEVGAGDPMPLSVMVINHKTDGHAVSYPVAFQVAVSEPECTAANPQCATLTANEVATNASGIATVTFLSGTTEAVTYTVKVSGTDAAPVVLTVVVNPKPRGTLQITFDPSDPVDLVAVPNKIKVMLGTGYKQCSQYSPINPWPAEMEKTVSGVGAKPTFEGLDPEATYWVTMLGWRGTEPDDHLVVYGCLDNVKVAPEEVAGETKVTLKVSTVVLIPAGTYTMVNHFDFSDVAMNLPGTAGQIITWIENVFTNPGKALLDGIKLLISTWVPAWVTDIAFGLFEDALADYITQWVMDNAPEPVQIFFEVGNDLLQIVNDLEVTGDLKISKLSASCMNGKESFSGITLYWKWGCDANDPPDCGVFHFGLEQLNNSDFPLDLVNGEWNGCLVGFDQLQIQPHSIKLNYGKLILFVLNDIMIPLVTGYDDLEDMLYSIVDCQNLAASISSGILDGIGISEQDLLNACNSVLATIMGPVMQSIATLSLPSQLFLQGSATFLDDDDNLTVDRIVDGVWTGEVTMGNAEDPENPVQTVGAVKGDFTATRAAFPGE